MNTFDTNKVWLALRFIALPAIVLPPFWLITYTTANCMSAIVPYSNIAGDHRTTTANMLHFTTSPIAFGVLFWTLLIVFLTISFLQIGTKKYRLRHAKSRQQLVVALISSALTSLAYIILYQFSQYKHAPNWSCDSSYMLHGGLSDTAHVGLGLAPVVTIVLIVLYLLAPLTAFIVTRPASTKLWMTK